MFSDGYANAVISPVKTILTQLYPEWMDSDKTENPTILGAVGFAGSEYPKSCDGETYEFAEQALDCYAAKWSRDHTVARDPRYDKAIAD